MKKDAHHFHKVEWTTWEGGLYRLYCVKCGRYLNYFTQDPPTLSKCDFWEAMACPKKISVNLEVHDVVNHQTGGF